MAIPLLSFILLVFLSIATVHSKSTIEPCSVSDTCPAMVGYTLYADLKVSELATLFSADPVSLLAANSLDFSLSDIDHRILPSGLFLKVPVVCSCSDGIRRSVSTTYRARPSDTLGFVAGSVFAGLVSADQIREANSLSGGGGDGLEAGQSLVIPLPCTCFNSSDNGLPAVYLSYVVAAGDTVAGIAARYSTTVTDIMAVNAMGAPVVKAGDIISVPLPACASNYPNSASDHGLIVANGSYAISASHCVQCSCGPGDLNLYCTPALLAVSCSSMQCKNSNLMVGNVTFQSTSGGCNVTSCSYGGFINGSIVATLSTSLQPQCPGQHQFPPLLPPPSSVIRESFLSPAPAPAESGGSLTTPKSSVPGTIALPGSSPANGPSGSISGACSLVTFLPGYFILTVLWLFYFSW
ncbi:LysM domain-containing GPI-anchored protein 1 [Acorus gramineus]|uniref:LysM domain-containing GPI-anchored protein 1 n=1 Tax=Acorus gramineus TaxID=55184 RepID=A0AAV9AGF6_ACOGR|nr:LysM domain-containing GPI-anchored protein 1 [Acorus gramineus]